MPDTAQHIPTSTAIDAIICMFFSLDTVPASIARPLPPAAAITLCQIAMAGEKGLDVFESQLGLRRAFERDEAKRIAEAGFDAVVKKGLAEQRQPANEGELPRLHLEPMGQQIVDNLRKVFANG